MDKIRTSRGHIQLHIPKRHHDIISLRIDIKHKVRDFFRRYVIGIDFHEHGHSAQLMKCALNFEMPVMSEKLCIGHQVRHHVPYCATAPPARERAAASRHSPRTTPPGYYRSHESCAAAHAQEHNRRTPPRDRRGDRTAASPKWPRDHQPWDDPNP